MAERNNSGEIKSKRARRIDVDERQQFESDIISIGRKFVVTEPLRGAVSSSPAWKEYFQSRNISTPWVTMLSLVRSKNLLERFPEFIDSIPQELVEKSIGQPQQGSPDVTNRLDKVGSLLGEVLKNKELSDRLTKEIRAFCETSTQKNIDAIDAASKEGDVIRKPIVIVGDGPVAGVVAKLISVVAPVTVITNDRSFGDVWQNRPLHINSSARRPDSLPLPVVGNTTPFAPDEYGNVIQLGDVARETSLRIVCSNGSIRTYADGRTFGRIIAAEAVGVIEDFIGGVNVDFFRTEELDDGGNRLHFFDDDGVERVIDADVVFDCTGPGKEVCRIPGDNAQAEFARTAIQVKMEIEEARKAYEAGETGYTYALPRFLSLTAATMLLEAWRTDFDRESGFYPFYDFLDPEKNVAYVGAGDTTLILVQLRNGTAPRDAYPDDFDPDTLKDSTNVVYNTPTEDPLTLRDDVYRERYKEVFSPGTVFRTERVEDVDINPLSVPGLGIQADTVTISASNGTAQVYDYVLCATGLDGETPNQKLPFEMQLAQDLDGLTVGKQNERGTFFSLGTAAKLRFDEFPEPIQELIKLLGIGENTVALWVHIPQVIRLILTFLSQYTVDEAYVDSFLKFSKENGKNVVIPPKARKIFERAAYSQATLRESGSFVPPFLGRSSRGESVVPAVNNLPDPTLLLDQGVLDLFATLRKQTDTPDADDADIDIEGAKRGTGSGIRGNTLDQVRKKLLNYENQDMFLTTLDRFQFLQFQRGGKRYVYTKQDGLEVYETPLSIVRKATLQERIVFETELIRRNEKVFFRFYNLQA